MLAAVGSAQRLEEEAEAREAAEAMRPVADAVLEGMRSQEAHDARSLDSA